MEFSEEVKSKIDAAWDSLPDGMPGFCRTWGYHDFAKALFAVFNMNPEAGSSQHPSDSVLKKAASIYVPPFAYWEGHIYDARHNVVAALPNRKSREYALDEALGLLISQALTHYWSRTENALSPKFIVEALAPVLKPSASDVDMDLLMECVAKLVSKLPVYTLINNTPISTYQD